MQSYNLEIWDSVEPQWKLLVSCNSTSYNVQVSHARPAHLSWFTHPGQGVTSESVSRTFFQSDSISFVSGPRTSTESESRVPNLSR